MRHPIELLVEENVTNPRKPVAVTTEERDYIVVVCDDGTVWELEGERWVSAGPPIPGSPADISRETD